MTVIFVVFKQGDHKIHNNKAKEIIEAVKKGSRALKINTILYKIITILVVSLWLIAILLPQLSENYSTLILSFIALILAFHFVLFKQWLEHMYSYIKKQYSIEQLSMIDQERIEKRKKADTFYQEVQSILTHFVLVCFFLIFLLFMCVIFL